MTSSENDSTISSINSDTESTSKPNDSNDPNTPGSLQFTCSISSVMDLDCHDPFAVVSDFYFTIKMTTLP